MIWIADALIYADSFPVVLASYEQTFAEITFETTYTKYNISDNFNPDGRIYWIEVPSTINGSDSLKIFADGELLGMYSFTWEHTVIFDEAPQYIIYSDSWFSYWYGYDQKKFTFFVVCFFLYVLLIVY